MSHQTENGSFLDCFSFVEAQVTTEVRFIHDHKLSGTVFSFFLFSNCSIFDGRKNEILSRRMQDAIIERYTAKNSKREQIKRLQGSLGICCPEIAAPLACRIKTNQLIKNWSF